ncbi:3-oxo-tetronate kinase [Paracoccus rhizosphaerae]|uniref:3-oxo-tetronate kinase n=1 Tax=Paracoccus rhizosphaerae TaxID=1133347 RepID=A0ABV6CG98_9RHOB|nr:3-oxo-tetronate kinase [Paracoccus rhizosphaerae]
MLIGVIADDFTGASDIANTLAKGVPPEGGLRTAQFSGVPTRAVASGIEAGVIALKSRSAPAEEAVRESLAALNWFRAQGCRQIVFKYCSTFDSTPAGNIGPVAEALARALDAKGVTVCPAFPTMGRTIYQGHLFVHDRLLSESGMEHHPLTPMTDPDIRRFLSKQTSTPVGLVPQQVVALGADAIAAKLAAAGQAGQVLCVVDAVCDGDLLRIGKASDGAPLLTGGSGIALGLPRNFIVRGDATGNEGTFTPAHGPAAILAGSCSGATRGQIDQHIAAGHPVYPIDVPEVLAGAVTAETLTEFISENPGAPLVYSSGAPDVVRQIQDRYGREVVAAQLDELFAETARQLLRRGWRRIVVAGGETSGAVALAVARELDVEAMTLGPEIDPGVPVLSLGQQEPVLLALKSGNFGAPDFFSKALDVMGGIR